MVIFENFHGNDTAMSLAVQAAETDTAYALVEASLGLEHLASSFVSDASHFLMHVKNGKFGPGWNRSL